jgi:GTP pyrophosphokinase
MLEEELRHNGLTLDDVTDETIISPLLKRFSFTCPEDLYAAIGYGGLTATKTVNRLRDDLVRAQKATGSKTALDKMNEAAERRSGKEPEKSQHAIQGVLVAGLDNCLIKFARCCTPVPGDDIVGFITRGYGVSVHRTDCRNHISSRLDPEEGGRWIEVSWADQTLGSYVTTLKVTSKDRSGLVMDIATALNMLNAKVRSLSARDLGDGLASTTLTVEVKDLAELKVIMARLSAIAGVSAVTRSNS